MYHRVGQYPGARRLVELAARFQLAPSHEGYATSPWEATVPLFQPPLAAVFPGEWTYAILTAIWANGTIPPHQDGDPERSGAQRFHLVLQSNPQSWTLHDGTWQQLTEDGIYTMDPIKTHAAVNWGGEPRIHLVVDVRR